MYAPDFIFSIVAASIAEKYLTTSFQLETVTVKHFGRLSEEYSSENHESLQITAENFLYTLADAGIDTADTYLQNYQFEKFKFKQNGKSRNWSPLIGNPIQALKIKSYTPNTLNREFKAFVYRTKQSGNFKCPNGWSLSSNGESQLLKDIGDIEVEAFDIIGLSD